MFEYLLTELEESIRNMLMCKDNNDKEDYEYFRGRHDMLWCVLTYIEEGRK